MSCSSRKGFTLIEILVVVSIIGILVAILTVNFTKVRGDARNKGIKTSLSEIQLSLAVYKAQNGRYPDADSGCKIISGSLDTADSVACGSAPYITSLRPDFIAALPSHTASGNSSCKIVYQVDKTNKSYYKLTAQNCFSGALAASTGIQPSDEYARCPSSCGTCNGSTFNATYQGLAAFYESMSVYSNGGECL